MRRIIVRAAVSVMLLGGATIACAFSTGPPLSRTNAFPVADKPLESNCTLCHWPVGAVNADPNGYVRIVGLPAQYTPTVIYPLEVHLFYDWTKDPAGLGPGGPRWGFQITSVVATSGDSAGSFLPLGIPPDSLQIMRWPPASSSKFKARAYLEHTQRDNHDFQNPDGLGGDIVWHFNWKAPPADSGKLYFFVAGNAANGDSCSNCGGDHIFSSVDSTVGGGPLAVIPPPHPGNFTTSFERPFPNPMTQCLNLQYEIAKAGMVDLAVFDLQGRKVRTLRHEHAEPSSYGEFWNGRNDSGIQMKNGVYYIRLIAPGLAKPISYRVTLAR